MSSKTRKKKITWDLRKLANLIQKKLVHTLINFILVFFFLLISFSHISWVLGFFQEGVGVLCICCHFLHSKMGFGFVS
ncbi:hypothetical protein AQUCO_07800016v1 [Aquilegia coerulea]|uniref:Uncharacterized protein n=1 Tax=Aquilegia coerulea TaxID=218851 RepID=A0A2G5C7W7_AQUCA|nr:hypothetical protein AQUCO_07800016v1 [Aquilegia coerulea]